MRRADRLFRIVQMLRSGRLKTARALAERLQVSERTIYRDVRDLQLNGQPIEGEAGVGYMLRRDFDLPPLMFTSDEVTALVLGARMVKAWGGTEMGAAAAGALARIEAVLPAELATRVDAIALYAPGYKMLTAHRRLLDRLHAACLARAVIVFTYTRLADDASRAEQRRVRPLALVFWSGVWTLAAWCETRNDFRTFRTDRMEGFADTGATFTPRRGQRLEDYLKQARANARKVSTSLPASRAD
jgi:predicted DNA-binding transcriptional regulator YafY